MNPQDAIDFSREAIKTCLMVGGPILIASLLIGLLVGVFQAMTQVQDQTVSFVPKILLLIVMIGLCLPWLTGRMMEFAQHSFETPMTQWAGTSKPKLFPKPKRNQIASTLSRPKVFQAATPNPTIGNQPNVAPRQMPTEDLKIDQSPTKSPFILPHYRISKAPAGDVGS
jgi:flagellar biosynthetic protein FliQ